MGRTPDLQRFHTKPGLSLVQIGTATVQISTAALQLSSLGLELMLLSCQVMGSCLAVLFHMLSFVCPTCYDVRNISNHL